MHSAVCIQEVFKKSGKGETALKMKSVVGGHWQLTMTNWEPSPKVILLQLHEKLPKNSTPTIIWSLGIWSKLERWKSWVSGCLMSWPRIKKSSFWSAVFLFYTTMNHFLIGLWRVMKSGFYNRRCPSQWLDQEEAPKHFWKPHLDQNKVMVTVWWSAAHHYSFLNPSKIVISEKCAQQINEMYWKLQCLQ